MLGNQLIELLMWERVPPMFTRLTALHNTTLQSMLSDLLYKDSLAGGQLKESVTQLPQYHEGFHLIAPEMKIALYESSVDTDYQSSSELLQKYIDRELYILGMRNEKPSAGYTLSGNQYILPNGEVKAGHLVRGIPILFNPADVQSHENIGLDTINAIQTALDSALAVLFRCSPSIQALITQTIESFTIVLDPGLPGGASSFYRRPGDIEITNIAKIPNNEKLAEHILHETIHSVLFLYEQFFPPITLRSYNGHNGLDQKVDIRTHSPWSGNFIGDVPLGHALFVYFGLLMFTIKLQAQEDLDQARLKRLATHNLSGFVAISDIKRYFINKESVNPWAMQIFEKMQRFINGNAHCKALLAL